MKSVIACFLLVLWVFLMGDAGAQDDCYSVFIGCYGPPDQPELSDVIAMIAWYRGCISDYPTCDCGPHGEYFPVCSDVDGNCIPMELSDVVFLICRYRGAVGPPVMCPDCY
jgi:hypothetical protein